MQSNDGIEDPENVLTLFTTDLILALSGSYFFVFYRMNAINKK